MPDTQEAVERHGAAVYRLAYAMTRSRTDADDIFQETFLRYHRAAPALEDEDHRRAWLLRTAANRAKSLLAAPWRKRSVPLEDQYTYTDPEESALDAALAGLPERYRAVVHLYYYEGYTTGEIAGLLRRQPGTVRSQLARARAMLRELLKEDL